MIRNLKALGLALVAMFAFGAVAASGASAQGVLTSSGPATLLGVETEGAPLTANRLTSFGGFVQCPGSTYTGHKVNDSTAGVPNGAGEATITPHYLQTDESGPNCTGPLGVSATIDMNGCDYVADIGGTTGQQPGVGGTYGVTFDVVCPPEKEITVTLWKNESEHTAKEDTPFCDLHVGDEDSNEEPTNQNLTGAHLTDKGDNTAVLSGTVEGIHVTRDLTHGEPGLLCSDESTETAKFDLDATVEDSAEGELSVSH